MTAQSKLKKNILKLILISVAGSVIYGLPYFRSYYYDAYLSTYGLTNTQMGMFGSIFGVMGAVSYLFGGVVADLVSPRKLMSISLVLTGIGGLLHLMHPGFGMLMFIYLLWGFTSLFAFWPALLKSLRSLANENEQSKAYGFMDGIRGITNAVHLAITLAIFNAMTAKANDLAGLNGVIVFYSGLTILLGVVVFFMLKDNNKDEKKDESSKINLSGILSVVKMPIVWILSMILCCAYTMNILFYYFTPYATAVLGMSAAAGAVVTMLAQYVRPVAAFSGGIAADRIGRPNLMFGTFTLMLAATLYLSFAHKISSTVFIGVCVLIYIGMYAGYSIVFSMCEESGIPKEVSGTAIGLICTIGYLPEVLCSLIAGKLLDAYGNAGYKMIFIILSVMMALGIVMLVIYKKYTGKMKEQNSR